MSSTSNIPHLEKRIAEVIVGYNSDEQISSSPSKYQDGLFRSSIAMPPDSEISDKQATGNPSKLASTPSVQSTTLPSSGLTSIGISLYQQAPRKSESPTRSNESTITDFSVDEDQRAPSRSTAAGYHQQNQNLDHQQQFGAGSEVDGQDMVIHGTGQATDLDKVSDANNSTTIPVHSSGGKGTPKPRNRKPISGEYLVPEDTALRINKNLAEENQAGHPKARVCGTETLGTRGGLSYTLSGHSNRTWGAGIRRAKTARAERMASFTNGELDPMSVLEKCMF